MLTCNDQIFIKGMSDLCLSASKHCMCPSLQAVRACVLQQMVCGSRSSALGGHLHGRLRASSHFLEGVLCFPGPPYGGARQTKHAKRLLQPGPSGCIWIGCNSLLGILVQGLLHHGFHCPHPDLNGTLHLNRLQEGKRFTLHNAHITSCLKYHMTHPENCKTHAQDELHLGALPPQEQQQGFVDVKADSRTSWGSTSCSITCSLSDQEHFNQEIKY